MLALMFALGAAAAAGGEERGDMFIRGTVEVAPAHAALAGEAERLAIKIYSPGPSVERDPKYRYFREFSLPMSFSVSPPIDMNGNAAGRCGESRLSPTATVTYCRWSKASCSRKPRTSASGQPRRGPETRSARPRRRPVAPRFAPLDKAAQAGQKDRVLPIARRGFQMVDSSARAEGGTRRDFLYLASGAVAGVGGLAAVWPLIDQMNPARDVLALASVEVDLAPIAEGQSITVMWARQAAVRAAAHGR